MKTCDILFLYNYRLPIPRWAKWIALDMDGSWWAYEQKPRPHASTWGSDGGRLAMLTGRDTRLEPDDWIALNWRTERWDLKKEEL